MSKMENYQDYEKNVATAILLPGETELFYFDYRNFHWYIYDNKERDGQLTVCSAIFFSLQKAVKQFINDRNEPNESKN